eukprot:scaffold197_cov82-Phaeocystis_antarctica.AAC.2
MATSGSKRAAGTAARATVRDHLPNDRCPALALHGIDGRLALALAGLASLSWASGSRGWSS